MFSQRRGLKPVKNVVQVDFVDDELRTGLWNTLSTSYWSHLDDSLPLKFDGDIHTLCLALWQDYFKWPIDTIGYSWSSVHQRLKWYFFDCQWYEVYDFIEFVAKVHASKPVNQKFMESCNVVLERELSAYRFVGGQITEITSEEEIAEVEEALKSSSSFRPVTNHLQRALELLTDRKSPDYRNSVKESISAVEAACNVVVGSSNATLGRALKELDKKKSVDMHPALKGAFDKLYGYTSDADGIRHALLQESNLDFEDAKFMLVSCSAFTNYLKAKSAKAGILL